MGQPQTLQEWAGASKLNICLLLTDIIGSTALAEHYGDDDWIGILLKHFERARALRDCYDCYEIKLIGDAYMVAFRTADTALEFAQQFVLDPGYSDIEIRAAIHVGPVLVHENDIYGLMVNKTQRLTGAIGDFPSIIVSDQAFPTIVSSLGKIGRQFFNAFNADLKGFGQERAWRFIKFEFEYNIKERHEEIVKHRADPFRPTPVRPLTPLFNQSPVQYLVERIKYELEIEKRMFLVVALEGASGFRMEDNMLHIEYAPESKHLADHISKDKSIELLRQVSKKMLGRDIGILIND